MLSSFVRPSNPPLPPLLPRPLRLQIALNGLGEYTGGGTFFPCLGRSLRPPAGHVLSFGGSILHGGDPLLSGVRYIIACFCYHDDCDYDCHDGTEGAGGVGVGECDGLDVGVRDHSGGRGGGAMATAAAAVETAAGVKIEAAAVTPVAPAKEVHVGAEGEAVEVAGAAAAATEGVKGVEGGGGGGGEAAEENKEAKKASIEFRSDKAFSFGFGFDFES